MRTAKKNRRQRNYAAEIAFDQKARALPPIARPSLLERLRRTPRRRPRTFCSKAISAA